jgi:1-deoxy-D-xylulose-5-phosphate reductoisomerase
MAGSVAVLGSTGSIGQQTLDVVRAHPDRLNVVALAAGRRNLERLAAQVKEFSPDLVCVPDAEAAKSLVSEWGVRTRVVCGDEGLEEVARHPGADIVLTAVVGTKGLRPTLKAIEAGKTIALANKETMVAAGHLVTKLAEERNVTILPVDSEHSAIFQCIGGAPAETVARIILTASGGAFRNKSREEMKRAGVREALAHPNWTMGAKITVDSATLMNKGLEVIEAHWLFRMPYDRIDVVIHPESVVHSLVEFVDQSIIAQLGAPDMRVPIQYALLYPERRPGNWPRLDLLKVRELHFEEPDLHKFPCLGLAYQAGREGGSMPAVLNAANEVATALFLEGRIGFLDIEALLMRVLDLHPTRFNPSLDEILEADRWARDMTHKLAIQGKVVG